MNLERMRYLWPLAWGKGSLREPFPDWSPNYTHSPIAYVDLALAQADAADKYVKGEPG